MTDERPPQITPRGVVLATASTIVLTALIFVIGNLTSPSGGGTSLDAGRPSVRASADARGRAPLGDLRAGSDPAVLPGPVLIADRDNNRLLEVSPTGQVLWRFPEPGDLAPGQSFELPDDAFYSPNGREVVVTQEDDFVISVVAVKPARIVFRYGHPGVPGSKPGYLHNPDDAALRYGSQPGQCFCAQSRSTSPVRIPRNAGPVARLMSAI